MNMILTLHYMEVASLYCYIKMTKLLLMRPCFALHRPRCPLRATATPRRGPYQEVNLKK